MIYGCVQCHICSVIVAPNLYLQYMNIKAYEVCKKKKNKKKKQKKKTNCV
jgi:hypothetical protein